VKSSRTGEFGRIGQRAKINFSGKGTKIPRKDVQQNRRKQFDKQSTALNDLANSTTSFSGKKLTS